jgi:hypothetical protein
MSRRSREKFITYQELRAWITLARSWMRHCSRDCAEGLPLPAKPIVATGSEFDRIRRDRQRCIARERPPAADRAFIGDHDARIEHPLHGQHRARREHPRENRRQYREFVDHGASFKWWWLLSLVA